MNKNKKGSILAFSLIILAMMLAIVTSLSVSTIVGKKSASSTGSSVQSLQTADSGFQLALKKINDNLSKPINDPAIYSACSGGVVAGLNDAGQGSYTLSFFSDAAGSTPSSCTDLAHTIKLIKSVGIYKNTVRAVEVKVAPGMDSYTKFLLHNDGSGSSFVDSSSPSKTITTNGNATQSSVQTKPGFGKSAHFDGVGDYLSTSSSPDFDFGTGDFTIDFWENSTNNSRQHALSFGQASVTNIDFNFNDPGDCDGSPKGIWVYWNGGGTPKICAGAPNAYTDGNWHHIALVRNANVITLYVDGTSVGNTNYPGAINLAGAATYYIGANASGAFYWNGYLDEIRISKGTARWTANFTPPTAPY